MTENPYKSPEAAGEQSRPIRWTRLIALLMLITAVSLMFAGVF
jgi:hypothetical protein